MNEPATITRAGAEAGGLGVPPRDEAPAPAQRARAHAQPDARSLALHHLIADKLRRDPALFARVRGTLERWRRVVDAGSRPYVDEWQRLADAGIEACLAAAVEDSPRGAARRQCSPLGVVLTHDERFEFFRQWAKRMQHVPTGA